jgi:hypothetical protein
MGRSIEHDLEGAKRLRLTARTGTVESGGYGADEKVRITVFERSACMWSATSPHHPPSSHPPSPPSPPPHHPPHLPPSPPPITHTPRSTIWYGDGTQIRWSSAVTSACAIQHRLLVCWFNCGMSPR